MELIGERRQSRPASGARSRSRGRTPSEMLARRQQLLAGSGSGEPGQAPGEASLGRAKESNGSEQSTSAELKLESLSAQLREQQQLELEAGGGSPNGPKSIADVYILLAKKEKDLQLAAELGKVLLERNEQLSKANEQMAEEFSQKLEVSSAQTLSVCIPIDFLPTGSRAKPSPAIGTERGRIQLGRPLSAGLPAEFLFFVSGNNCRAIWRRLHC